MNRTINENPSYFESPTTEFQSNPLIEVLAPRPATLQEAGVNLARKPKYDESELGLPSRDRAMLPARLLNSMFPTSQHTELQSRLYGQVVNGYRGGKPSPQESASISLVTGLPGIGKSTLVHAIMRSMRKPVITRSNCKGVPFTETQILYMMRNLPAQCSVKNVCMGFAECADKIIGRKRYANLFVRKSMTSNQYIAALREVVANHHVGALVIDEFQNVGLAKTEDKNKLFALFSEMRYELGVPIILVGSYPAVAEINHEASIARQFIKGGVHELKRSGSHEESDWRTFCDELWQYQWVRRPQTLNDEIVEVLYRCSQGIIGILLNLFVTAQTLALEGEKETVTPSLIVDVFKGHFRPIHPIIEMLNRNELSELAMYDDLYSGAMAKLMADPVQARIKNIRLNLARKQKER